MSKVCPFLYECERFVPWDYYLKVCRREYKRCAEFRRRVLVTLHTRKTWKKPRDWEVYG